MMIRIRAPMPMYMPSAPCLYCGNWLPAPTVPKAASMRRDHAAGRLHRASLGVPALQAAGHRRGVEAGPAKGLRGHQRAHAGPADEDDRLRRVDRGRLRGQPLELDVAGAGNVPRLAFVGLAHVDDLRAPVGECALDLRGRDLEGGVDQRVGHDYVVVTDARPAPAGA